MTTSAVEDWVIIFKSLSSTDSLVCFAGSSPLLPVSVPRSYSIYLSLVWSQLLYCSPIWCPHHLRDVRALESVQTRATKFIPNDHLTNHRHNLLSLNLLPLMMIYEINDIIFFTKYLKQPSKRFNILSFVILCSTQTWLSTYQRVGRLSM